MLFTRKYNTTTDGFQIFASADWNFTGEVVKTNRVKVYGGFSGRNLKYIDKPEGWVYQ
jgi:hypothetical protein